MAKIRLYKLAEELGIDRNELVDKAKSFGIDVKSAMASLEDDQAQMLREKLGGVPTQEVVQRTVEAEGGRKVIRRRRVRVETAAPESEPAAVELVAAHEAVAAEAEVAPAGGEEAEIAPLAAEPEPIAAAATAPSAPAAPKPTAEERARRGPAPPAPPRGTEAPADAGRGKRQVREVVNLREQEQIARQLSGRTVMRRPIAVEPRTVQSPRRKRRDAPVRPAAVVAPKQQKRVIRIEGSISVGELARELGQKAPAVQGKLMALGTMASVNQAVDVEIARQVAAQFGFEVQDVGFREEEVLGAAETASAENRTVRPPIITVMGHVDHGKTSILDALRQTDVVAGEAGGITQHIGAYQVTVDGEKLTFIDTPGHEAFTMMRARGAQVTDIVVLVVAATEGIMPQTVEAISHAKAAGVPIVVAINKCDLPDANPRRARERLMEHGLVSEEYGGDTICVETSATQRTGLDKLLEMLRLQAEVLELRADATRRARGVVLEAQLDKGLGPVATVLVQDGTLRRGDVVVAGTELGRVRMMQNDRGQNVDEAGPSVPVRLVGLSGVPESGQTFNAVEDERSAKDVVAHRIEEHRMRSIAPARPRLSLDELFARSGEEGGTKELAVVVKADVHGSVEALREALTKLATDEVKVKVILAGVGAVTESDVMLAKASDAIVVGFHVRPDPAARRAAENQGVDLRLYRVIYEATDDVRKAMAGLLPPTISEVQLGRAEVRRTFNAPRVGTIAGSYVLDGTMRRGARCRLVRDGVVVHDGRIGSLKRFKDDAREVQAGFECGIWIEGYNDVKLGDVVEAYTLEEKPATLG
jgi:translation initiation factor IF-2